jgi:putative oxidoreductase
MRKEGFVKPILKPFHDHTYSLLRILAGLMFLIHGTMIVFGEPPSPMKAGSLATLGGISGILELILGGLVMIGLFTSVAAFIASGEMAVAYFIVHAPKGFFPHLNQGELAVLYCFIFLYIAANGAGLWSIDHLIWGRRATATVTATT